MRFEILVDKNIFNQASSGIGLTLVKELVEMHKATISVDSRLGEGSCFKVDFLKGKEHYNSSVEFILEDSVAPLSMERIVDIANSSLQTEAAIADAPDLEVSAAKEEAEESSSKELMLLGEDNQELRSFLRSIFASTYRVVEASDGMEGWSKALKYLPDIIISDVMMPEKDGIEMTRELRADMTTSHIPIILLTAKTNIQSKIEGMELGADAYIEKPFSVEYLQACASNLIQNREKLRQAFAESPFIAANTMALTKADEEFIKKLNEVIRVNYANPEFSMDDMADNLNMSRSNFYRKIKGVLDLSPNEFLRLERLKKAAQLLKEGENRVNEICYMVGFNSPSYFAKCFQKQFGVLPKDFTNVKE